MIKEVKLEEFNKYISRHFFYRKDWYFYYNKDELLIKKVGNIVELGI